MSAFYFKFLCLIVSRLSIELSARYTTDSEHRRLVLNNVEVMQVASVTVGSLSVRYRGSVFLVYIVVPSRER